MVTQLSNHLIHFHLCIAANCYITARNARPIGVAIIMRFHCNCNYTIIHSCIFQMEARTGPTKPEGGRGRVSLSRPINLCSTMIYAILNLCSTVSCHLCIKILINLDEPLHVPFPFRRLCRKLTSSYTLYHEKDASFDVMGICTHGV